MRYNIYAQSCNIYAQSCNIYVTFHRKKVLPRKSRFYLWEFAGNPGNFVGIVAGNCGKCSGKLREFCGKKRESCHNDCGISREIAGKSGKVVIMIAAFPGKLRETGNRGI